MAKYKISGTGVDNTETGYWIPNDTSNVMWREYQTWTTVSGNVADPEFTEQEIEDNWWSDLRSERDRLLTATDFMMSYDYYNSVMSSQEQTDVSGYRSDLRDLPSNTPYSGSGSDIDWPTKPQIVLDNGI